MARDDYLELKGICRFEMKIELTYRHLRRPFACEIKEVTWACVNGSGYKGYIMERPIVKWYNDFIVISIGEEVTFDDDVQCILNEELDLRGNVLAYCDEESLAIIIGKRMNCNYRGLVEMLKKFLTKDKWVCCVGENITISPTPIEIA